MNLEEIIRLYLKEGYELADASAKVAQDVLLLKISQSILSKNVTIKGGVIMHSLSKDKRRSTRDVDIDFIKYSLGKESIQLFIDKLNLIDDGVKIVLIKEIEELHHQDYAGKRVYVSIIDNYNYRVDTKLDIGVHKNFDIEQEEYCFDFNVINQSATLFVNSKEQIFVEKIKSLLKFGILSTRYKDILDMYFLITEGNIRDIVIKKYIQIMIFDDCSIRVNNYEEMYNRLNRIFNNKLFIMNLNNTKNNWLGLSSDILSKEITKYIISLEEVFII